MQKILLAKAANMGIVANDDDVRSFLKTGQLGEFLFPQASSSARTSTSSSSPASST